MPASSIAKRWVVILISSLAASASWSETIFVRDRIDALANSARNRVTERARTESRNNCARTLGQLAVVSGACDRLANMAVGGRIQSTDLRVTAVDVTYEDREDQLPKSVSHRSWSYQNCGPNVETLSEVIDLSYDERATVSVEKSLDLGSSISAEFSLSEIGLDIGWAGNRTYSVSTKEVQSFTSSKKVSKTYDVQVPPNSLYYLEIFREELNSRIPFSGTVEVDANLSVGSLSLGPLRRYFSPQDRSFEVAGAIETVEVVNISARRLHKPLDPASPSDCEPPPAPEAASQGHAPPTPKSGLSEGVSSQELHLRIAPLEDIGRAPSRLPQNDSDWELLTSQPVDAGEILARVECGSAINAGQPAELPGYHTWSIANSTNSAVGFRVHVALLDDVGHEFNWERDYDLDPGQLVNDSVESSITVNYPESGAREIWATTTITGDIQGHDRHACAQSVSDIPAVPPAPRAPRDASSYADTSQTECESCKDECVDTWMVDCIEACHGEHPVCYALCQKGFEDCLTDCGCE